jgi:hypothetical protein
MNNVIVTEKVTYVGLMVAAIFLTGAVLGIIAGVKLSLKRREAEDNERLKALEAGYYLPKPTSQWPAALFCLGVGAGVPIVTFVLNLYGMQAGNFNRDSWIGTTMVSIFAIVGSTVVASLALTRNAKSVEPKPMNSTVKPVPEDHSFDFGGRIGRG